LTDSKLVCCTAWELQRTRRVKFYIGEPALYR